MKTIKKYEKFINEDLNFNFFKKKKDNTLKNNNVDDIYNKKTYDDDELFDKIFIEIKTTFNNENLLRKNGWTYNHSGDEINIFNYGKSNNIYELNINNTSLKVNQKMIKELYDFFSNEYNKNYNKNIESKQNIIKKDFTGQDNINNNDFYDIVFNELKNYDIKEIKWSEVKNGSFGYTTQINNFTIGVINTKYPTENLFINECGFEMDYNQIDKIWKYLDEKHDELVKRKTSSNKQSLRDKYIK